MVSHKNSLVDKILQPISDVPLQAYLDNRLQLFDVLEYILRFTGPADLRVSTFSTSEEFLRRLFSLKKRGLITHALLLADLKAAKKTVNLASFMSNVFDTVYLTENHSKILLVSNDEWLVTVVTSQNQTRGNRTECGMISTDPVLFLDLKETFENICETRSIYIDGIYTTTDRRT